MVRTPKDNFSSKSSKTRSSLDCELKGRRKAAKDLVSVLARNRRVALAILMADEQYKHTNYVVKQKEWILWKALACHHLTPKISPNRDMENYIAYTAMYTIDR